MRSDLVNRPPDLPTSISAPIPAPKATSLPGTAMRKGDVTTFVPQKDWKDVGNQTPAAAFETYLWAATNGEIDRLKDVIEIGDWKGRDDFFRNLSDAQRAKFESPNKVAALIVASDAKDIVAIPGVSFAGDSGHVFSAKLALADGREVVGVFWARQVSDGFRIEVPAHVVEGFLAGDRKRPSAFQIFRTKSNGK